MTLYDFLAGAIAFGFLICSLFFVRFWTRTRDQLFLTFALAFALMGIGQAIIPHPKNPTEERGPVYLIRLTAFLLILVGIYRKNRTP
jgi:hypothetical protein